MRTDLAIYDYDTCIRQYCYWGSGGNLQRWLHVLDHTMVGRWRRNSFEMVSDIITTVIIEHRRLILC